jgi:hypothetical protein
MNPKGDNRPKVRASSAERPKPDPKRFDKFDLISDESGFKIQGCDHIFYFDRFGGWFDEHKNYYNDKGEPSTPPNEEAGDDSLGDFEDEIGDKLAAEYDDGGGYDDDDAPDNYDLIYENAENVKYLALYVPGQLVDVDIANLNYKSQQNDLVQFLDKEHIMCDFLEYEWDTHRNRFTGRANLQLDHKEAEKVLKLNGAKFWGRDIKVIVRAPSDADPEDVPADVIVPLDTLKTLGDQKKEEKKVDEKPKEEKKKEDPKPKEQPKTESKKVESKVEKKSEPKKPESESTTKDGPIDAAAFEGGWGKPIKTNPKKKQSG